MLSPAKKKELAAQAQQLNPILNVGKNGLSDSFVNELSLLVRKKGLLKVKLLPAFADQHDAKAVANVLAEKVDAEVVSVVGHTIVFYRPVRSKK